MKTKSPLNRKAQLALRPAVLALLVVGVISYRRMVVSGENERWVRQTQVCELPEEALGESW
jgi:hypothetical protein